MQMSFSKNFQYLHQLPILSNMKLLQQLLFILPLLVALSATASPIADSVDDLGIGMSSSLMAVGKLITDHRKESPDAPP